jgi:hypothetical protein
MKTYSRVTKGWWMGKMSKKIARLRPRVDAHPVGHAVCELAVAHTLPMRHAVCVCELAGQYVPAAHAISADAPSGQ